MLPSFRKSGVGSLLLDQTEKIAIIRSNVVGIGVGLYAGKDGGYGSAQRLYIKRGYIPDGKGVTYHYAPTVPGNSYRLDDDLVLWLTKTFKQENERVCQMKPRINMITLGTKDLGASTKFYTEGLGFKKMDFEGDISFFALNGSWLALYQWELLAQDAQINPSSTGFRGITLSHNVENERQVTNILEQAKNAGARIIKQAQKTEWGGFSGYFADLDEHLWEIAYNPFFWPGPKD